MIINGPTRKCAICGITVADISPLITAHEFACYKMNQAKIPKRHQLQFSEVMLWEIRSMKSRAAQRRLHNEQFSTKQPAEPRIKPAPKTRRSD